MQERFGLWITKCYTERTKNGRTCTMIAACEEHIELALDVAVDEWETAPIVEQAKEPRTCQFCEEKAVYTLTK
ncbi:hypothetical protein AN965_07260 [Alkalicoccobacillus plakortidis]|nr:hypothetical protein AN965_07260 [Alkalicoccobacillus plakortidis]MBG9785340.1 hypothetical protein [Shouchella lehensis]